MASVPSRTYESGRSIGTTIWELTATRMRSGPGVDVFNGKRWQHISHEDGLIWDDIDSNAFFNDRDGSVWIGTSSGIAHIVHPEQIFHSTSLRVALGEARLGSDPLPLDGSGVFPWKRRSLTLRLSVSDLSRAHAVEYHFRLAGLESDWTIAAEPEVRYISLPPGGYRFEAFAVGLDLNCRTPVVALTFRILAPWWQRLWFYALLALAGMGLLTLSWRWRHRALLQRQHHLDNGFTSSMLLL